MKSVAIVGFSEKTFDYCLNSKADEIWTMNHARLALKLPRIDRMFEIHKRDWYLRKEVADIEMYDEWLRSKHPFPIYMQEKELTPLVPSGVRYPFEEICKEFFSNFIEINKEGIETIERDYFTSSVPFMIALAIYEGFDKIELYGIDMAIDTEYAYQKPCGEFWVGIALGRGIKVVVPDICTLCQAPIYAYDIIPYIDPTLINELMAVYEIKHQDYIRETIELAEKVKLNNKDEELIEKYLMASAYQYMYQGALMAATNIMNESDNYVSRMFIEMKSHQFVRGMDFFRNQYNQKRTLHDHLLSQGQFDEQLWTETQDARASMYANLGALQLFIQLIQIIDMRPFERELSLDIREDLYKNA